MKPEGNLTPNPFPFQEGEDTGSESQSIHSDNQVNEKPPSPPRRGARGEVNPDFSNKNPLESSLHALDGLSEYTRRSRRNWLYQVFISIAVVGVALWASLDAVRLALVILSIALVLAVEILNTALEILLNWLQPEYHAVAKTVKDLAAGAVLIVSLGVVGAGFLLFWTPIAGPTYESVVLRVVGSSLMLLFGVSAWASGRAKR